MLSTQLVTKNTLATKQLVTRNHMLVTKQLETKKHVGHKTASDLFDLKPSWSKCLVMRQQERRLWVGVLGGSRAMLVGFACYSCLIAYYQLPHLHRLALSNNAHRKFWVS